MSHGLTSGTALVIRLKGATPDAGLTLAADVVHSTQELDGSWRVGCLFREPLSAEKMDALL
jgi:hypothetical protein